MMTTVIETAQGNLLAADADALVNTVNTVGVMGKGIALQFRRAYPAMFEDYRKACKAGTVEVGRMHVWATGQITGPRYIVNFPTKKHWRSPSELDYITDGLEDLVRIVTELGIASVAIPPLGAGNGGLDWADVQPKIIESLGDLDIKVLLYEPNSRPAAREMVTAQPVTLTPGRAALVALLARYSTVATGASLIEVQKLMYFLQQAGEPLRLRFQPHHYGPYADNLRHVLREVEGVFLTGFGDGDTPVRDSEPIEVLPGAESQALDLLAERPETTERIDRVLALLDGFDSMYGTELLATVHWAAVNSDTALDLAQVTRSVQDWSRRKAEIFTERHIATAWSRLNETGWLHAG